MAWISWRVRAPVDASFHRPIREPGGLQELGLIFPVAVPGPGPKESEFRGAKSARVRARGLLSLRRLRKSIRLWHKQGGRQGYLKYVREFLDDASSRIGI